MVPPAVATITLPSMRSAGVAKMSPSSFSFHSSFPAGSRAYTVSS